MIAALQSIVDGGVPLPVEALPGEDADAGLLAAVNQLILHYAGAYEYILDLAQGNLSVEPPRGNQMAAPFKTLHANLSHLTWQTQQIAAGDLSQRVDFMGDFSIAFNQLIKALREKRKLEEQLQYMSVHDTLTGLYNRAFFNEELGRLSKGRGYPISIIIADIDGLKQTNDTHGHEAGDRLICSAAAVLAKAIRGDDILARIGGDEFAILLPVADAANARLISARIRAEQRLVNALHETLPVSISVGAATAHHADQISDAMRLADERMYADKARRGALRRDRPDGD